MTIYRYREARGGRVEQRNLAGVNPGGYQLMDPSAIPPHGYDHMGRAGVLVTPHAMLTVDVVYTALRIISNNIIKMGNLRAFTWGFYNGYPYKQFAQRQPTILTNTFGGGGMGGRGGSMMQCTGMDRTIWSMALFGEAFWYILTRDALMRPTAIEVLHPAFMEVKVDNGAVKYVYGSAGNRRELDSDNVIHIPMKSLPAARRALSPTDYAGVAGALALAAYEFGSSWFSQGASPSFLLTTDQKLGATEVQRIAEKFLIEHSGLSQAHLPLVLDSGIKATKALNTPDEAQYLETLEYARQVLGAWFGIPPSKMPNALQRQPAASPHARQEEIISFQQDTLSGYTVPLEEVHSALIPDADTFACFDESQLSQPDAQFLAQEIQALRITQAASINDVRVRKLGWAPTKDARADDPIMPLASNVAPSQTGSQAKQGNGQGGSPDAPSEPENGPEGDDEERALSWLLRRIAGQQHH